MRKADKGNSPRGPDDRGEAQDRHVRRADDRGPSATAAPIERAVLAGVHLPLRLGGDLGGAADLEELGRLADTAGAAVTGQVEQRRDRPEPATFVGKGKLAELKALVASMSANLVVFDNDLSPAQGRNLERELGARVIDRTELILDIFARHARTREARVQVELAQLQYALPRLTRLWSHLERQAGGIGTRGPGETQLETDRRLISRRIAQLKRELVEVGRDRRVQRHGRRGEFTAALVGYTNAGKSTLMNGLTEAGVPVEDRLFATLDATTRRVELDARRRFLLTDTVGFIRRLPHHLVESFQATLQEVADADLLVHVVDAASPDPQRQIDAVNRVLADLVPEDRDIQIVFNKLDRVDADEFCQRFASRYAGALFISAREPAGVEAARAAIRRRVVAREIIVRLLVPAAQVHALAVFHRTADVLEEVWDGPFCRVVVRLRAEELRRLLARYPGIRREAPQ